MDHIYDYLIAFNVTTAVPDNPSPKPISSNTMLIEDTPTTGRIIQICWATYDIKKEIMIDECQYFVKPLKYAQLSQATIEKTRITNQQMEEKAVPLTEVMHKFNEALYINYICNNASFCLVTPNDQVLMTTLPQDAQEAKVKLPNHFFTYFDITEEFRKTYKLSPSSGSLGDFLGFLKLKPTEAQNLGEEENKNVLRLIHRIVKDGHKFQNPKVLNSSHQLITENIDLSRTGQVVASKKWSTFIRSKSPEAFRNPTKKWYIRMRGLPFGSREAEVIEFLRGIRVYNEDIVFLYDYEGKFTGEAYVQLHNEADFKEAISFNLSDLGSRYIEVFETNENEMAKAKASQFPEKREMKLEQDPAWSHLLQDSVGIIKMRGLPYSCTEEDIKEFFKGFPIVQDGIKRAVHGGRPSGECFVVFEAKDSAFSALGLNMEKIGNRFIELFNSNVRELEIYLNHNFSQNAKDKQDLPNIPLDKRKSTLKMVGLPFNVTKDNILKFLNGFNVKDEDVHLINGHSGKFSGQALITFSDELEAQRALKTKNLSYINNRYIEFYEYR